ncbi:MAG TPA: AsnC family transcriptional regulator, partial [Rhodobacter sp.]|nr:AsnC family transcriptional regulator [Rhodobacter sp.]
MIDIDAIDRQILRSLAQDASQNASILGRQLGLSQ